MKRLDTYIRAFDRPLKKRPKVFDPVRVNLTVNILLSMIDNRVNVFIVKVPVRRKIVRVDIRSRFNVLLNNFFQRLAPRVRNDLAADFTMPLKQAHNGDLANESSSADSGALRFVHEPRFATDESSSISILPDIFLRNDPVCIASGFFAA
jgi:hypothetical protein